MAATVRLSYFGASSTEPAGVTAESGFKFNREDTLSGTTGTIPQPTATGTNFSWPKQLALEVTATSTTNITNRAAYLGSAVSAGMTVAMLTTASNTYAQSAAAPTASGSNDAVPASYTALTTSPQNYDTASVATSSTGRNGKFLQLVLGISNNFLGGAGASVAVPDIKVQYSEA